MRTYLTPRRQDAKKKSKEKTFAPLRLCVPLFCLGLVAGWLLFSGLAGAQEGERQSAVSPARVLVVKNIHSADSVAIADYYVRKRHVPKANVCEIVCPTVEECSREEFQHLILEPVKRALGDGKRGIDFILLTKGIPIRTHEGDNGGFCTDSLLATLDWTLLKSRTPNPYFGQRARFSHTRYNIYLVTRLDGYTRADCLKLIDNALTAKPLKGPFLIHTGPGHEKEGYRTVNDGMRKAHKLLSEKGLQCRLDTGDAFISGQELMGYFSWGSNDGKYDKNAYHSLTFLPGAIAETAVSTSGRTFADPKAPGQSLIADLIAQGVTGCKGYVSEPFADSIALADILFDRYTSGYTLAESFYMASRYIYWKDIILGDPLCAPYAAPAQLKAGRSNPISSK